MMPNSIGDYPGGEWIFTVQDVLCVFQSTDGVLRIGGVIEGFEKTSRHGIARCLVVSLTKKRSKGSLSRIGGGRGDTASVSKLYIGLRDPRVVRSFKRRQGSSYESSISCLGIACRHPSSMASLPSHKVAVLGHPLVCSEEEGKTRRFHRGLCPGASLRSRRTKISCLHTAPGDRLVVASR